MEKGGERQTRATGKGAETNNRDDGMVRQLFLKFVLNQETVKKLVSLTMARFVLHSF